MYYYFDDEANDKFKTTSLPNSLPAQLNRDLKSINKIITLRNIKDLQDLNKIAQKKRHMKNSYKENCQRSIKN